LPSFSRFIQQSIALFTLLFWGGTVSHTLADDTAVSVKHMVGQKIMLDLRYFCSDGTSSSSCRKGMTVLPSAIKTMLVKHHIGGVILFSENIESTAQVSALTAALQNTMTDAELPSMFIAVDQEGGRVARFPAHMVTPFLGNMAIGATFDKTKSQFSTQVGEHLGTALRQLGVNVNFAPSVDVNSEPRNPVINVRSFSSSANTVAQLGASFVSSMQRQGVLSALKHFPGHGDTQVDSHTGLPLVTHDIETTMSQDVLPFAHIIQSDTPPAMIMSAHIQYPSLDSNKMVTTQGKAVFAPATLSKPILTGLLRNTLKYQGLIVTDALDMAGIANYFSQQEAVVKAFDAGADIALMPYTIRTPEDIAQFDGFMTSLVDAVSSNIESAALKASYQRIMAAKQRLTQLNPAQVETITANDQVLMRQTHIAQGREIETALAQASITSLYGAHDLAADAKQWLVLMPDSLRCNAMQTAMATVDPSVNVTCVSYSTRTPQHSLVSNVSADAVLIGDISPRHSAYEMGNENFNGEPRSSSAAQYAWLTQQAQYFQNKKVPMVYASLRMPYQNDGLSALADVGLATYSYRADTMPDGTTYGAAFNSLAEVLLGKHTPQGKLPVPTQH